ncbi:MAG: hypothetical protein EOP49_52345, partial [Sphingobacteriales bacterium]
MKLTRLPAVKAMIRQLLSLLMLLLAIVAGNTAVAQKATLVIIPADSSAITKTILLDKKPLPLRQQFDRVDEAYTYLRKLIPRMQEQGYLAASVDSVAMSDTAATAWLYQGGLYQWAKLSFAKIPTALLNSMNISVRDWEQQIIGPSRYAALTERMLKYCEDNGYPFAHVSLDQLQRNEQGLQAELVLDRGNLVYIDSLVIQSDVEVSRDFIQNYLGIRQGDLY